MYPNLYFLFKYLFGLDLPFLKIANTFGFCVAISFLGAAYLQTKELQRKQAQGLMGYETQTITVGAPASQAELLINFLLGFVFGYKILGVLFTPGALNTAQDYIFSLQGNWWTGIALGAFFLWLKWREKQKLKVDKPTEEIVKIYPSDRVGDFVIIAAVFGFLGAKIFDNLENWDRFIQDPIGNLFSASGLTFYGGLIVATIALGFYFKKHRISFINMCDATAPGLMFAYGWGRMGCQVAGDGDWGVINTAYVSTGTGKVIAATPDQFNDSLHLYSNYYNINFGGVEKVQTAHCKAFAGLPDWMFAYTYPHNVNRDGIPLTNCTWSDYCNHLPLPVFPTPAYEIIVCLILFGVLWAFRKKIKIPGRMFGIYLMMNGLERWFIEHIRVNTRYTIFGFYPTQAELISSLLFFTGLILYWQAPKWFAKKQAQNT
jgi:phosphatidylglycerol:prolipoprotein diacylglycerol transferase